MENAGQGTECVRRHRTGVFRLIALVHARKLRDKKATEEGRSDGRPPGECRVGRGPADPAQFRGRICHEGVPLRSVIPAALALSFATPHAGAGADIRSVTLSTAGLALLEAEAEMGAAPIELSIRRTDIDDFLKSFWLRDPAGSVPRLRLPGDGAFADVFALLPLDPEDLSDQARLLDAMIGAPLAVERLGAVQRGRNMGVAERPCEDGTCLYLSLAQADGLTRHRLDAGAEVRFTEVDDRAMIARGLDAWRGQAGPGTIPVEVESAADTPRMVEMVWLQDAPTWRTAYRAIETEAGLQLQGWAVVENATGHDWQEVSLTLATGDVRALDVDLYTRKEVAREQAEAPRARGTADAAVGRTQTRGLALSPASAPAAQVEAEDGVSFSRYTLSEPVTLGAGEMVSLPFLDETLANARLLLHRGGQGRSHPRIALALENPLPLRLPGGVLTLYAAGRGHAGDAMIPEIPGRGRGHGQRRDRPCGHRSGKPEPRRACPRDARGRRRVERPHRSETPNALPCRGGGRCGADAHPRPSAPERLEPRHPGANRGASGPLAVRA